MRVLELSAKYSADVLVQVVTTGLMVQGHG